MIQPLKLSDSAQALLSCPACKSKLTKTDARFSCTNPTCNSQFPTVDGVPVLINDNSSLFSIDDFVSHRQTTFDLTSNPIKVSIKRLLPRLGRNIKGRLNYQELARLLLCQPSNPRVLIIGGSILGEGTEALLRESRVEAVVVQAVLHCVTEPARCVGEIHRVLKKQGLVYAETSFMQQVVDAPYDFTRLTHLGVRRLFRNFEEIESGVVCGPGMALAWSLQFFMLSFAESKLVRGAIRALCQVGLCWLKYFDYYLAHKPASFDAASGFYFMGRKSEHTLSDRDLVRLYRGSR